MSDLNYKEEIEKILKDKTSGSGYIANQIERIFFYIPEGELEKTILDILKTHSSMASIINRINYLCLKREGVRISDPEDFSERMFNSFWNENRGKKNWITLSMSSWVIELFKKSKEKLNLKIGISYPDKEGLQTFEQLKGIHNIQIYEDNKLVSEVEKTDGIILGADLITEDFIVNKTGSFSLAIAADYFKKPLFIISSGDKYLNDELHAIYRLKIKRMKSRIIHYFERIPSKFITKIYLTSTFFKFPISRTLKRMKDKEF